MLEIRPQKVRRQDLISETVAYCYRALVRDSGWVSVRNTSTCSGWFALVACKQPSLHRFWAKTCLHLMFQSCPSSELLTYYNISINISHNLYLIIYNMSFRHRQQLIQKGPSGCLDQKYSKNVRRKKVRRPGVGWLCDKACYDDLKLDWQNKKGDSQRLDIGKRFIVANYYIYIHLYYFCIRTMRFFFT